RPQGALRGARPRHRRREPRGPLPRRLRRHRRRVRLLHRGGRAHAGVPGAAGRDLPHLRHLGRIRSRPAADPRRLPRPRAGAMSPVPASSPPSRLVRTKTSTAVVDYVLELLFTGALRSGDRIDHDELGAALGVSRLPVREALVMLERDGIVSTRYHRGVYVEPFDAPSILDDFEIMGLLSGVAVRRLAETPDPEAIAVLQGLVDDLRVTDPADRDRIAAIVTEIMTTEHRAGGSRRLRAELRTHAGFLPHAFQYIDRNHATTVD